MVEYRQARPLSIARGRATQPFGRRSIGTVCIEAALQAHRDGTGGIRPHHGAAGVILILGRTLELIVEGARS